MSDFSWKEDTIPLQSSVNYLEREDYLQPENEEEKKFDMELFFKNLKLLIFQNQVDLLFQIEEQIKPFNITELFCVLNSQLPKYVFNHIENCSNDEQPQFLMSCLKLCYSFTSINVKKNPRKFLGIQKRYQDFITEKFIDSLKQMLNHEDLTIPSLLIISNTFYQLEQIYEYYNIFEILEKYSKSEDDKIISICSLILKRLLRCDFHSNWNENFPVQIFDTIVKLSNIFLRSTSVFAQIKSLQTLAKLIITYRDQIYQLKNFDFNKHIIEIINYFSDSTESAVFGNILYIILLFIEKNKNMEQLFSFFEEIEICKIIKNGLSTNISFIQMASSDILLFLISFPSPFTLQLLVDSKMIEFIIQTIRNSCFKGKEKIRKAVFGLFLREDLSFDEIFESDGVLFLIENISMWASEIIPILKMLIIKHPRLVEDLLNLNIISELDFLIFEDQQIDEHTRISAQALKKDISVIAKLPEQA